MLLAGALAVEAVAAASWLLQVVPTLGTARSATLALIALRGAVSILQFAGAFLLIQRKPSAPLVAGFAAIAAAVLLVVEQGTRLVPTNVFPSHRLVVVLAYWAYVGLLLTGIRWLRGRHAHVR